MSAKPLADRELWFVAGSQDLYGEAVIEQAGADAREIAAALEQAQTIPV